MAEYADEAIQKIKAAVEERKADQKAAKKARKSGILELINAAHAKNTQERLIHLSLMTPENLINELQKLQEPRKPSFYIMPFASSTQGRGKSARKGT